jgi:DNA-binding NarL/FixJ family response regulator
MVIIVADDERVVLAAFRFMLERKLKGVRVCCAKQAEQLLDAVERRCPEVVILDWELPGEKPLPLINKLRDRCPNSTIIVTSMLPGAESRAIHSGADKVISKGEPPDGLIAYLQQLTAAQTPALRQ